MSYYNDFGLYNLMNVFIEIETRLQLLGMEYVNKSKEPFSKNQKEIRSLHKQGYEVDEQIYDHYSEMGGILQEIERRFT